MELIKLPKKAVKPTAVDPEKLLLLGHTKVGKTTIAAQIPNSLLIDLEGSAKYLTAVTLNVKTISKAKDEDGKALGMVDALSLVIKSIASSEMTYDYIIIDNTTVLEKIATELATRLYKRSPIGKNFKGTDVVVELPNGAGYGLARSSFELIYKSIESLANKGVILIGHIKKSSIRKDGKDLNARDLELSGKLKTIVAADMDAIGYISREPDGSNSISFKTDPQDLVTGSRCPHLRNKKFTISRENDKKEIETYWENVFISLKNKK